MAKSNLRFLARWLQRDGHAVKMVPYDNGAPLLSNVQAVRETIAAIKEETGQDEVILIAHSLGGLVARTYLATGATDVAGLATLGTPHAGVRMAYELLVTHLATDSTPNIRELLPEHMALIAPFMERGNVAQLHIGGNLLPKENLFVGFPPHDGIISAANATSAPGATRVYSFLHGWSIPTLQFGIPSFLWPDRLYLNTLRPWIQSLPDAPWQARSSALSLPAAGFTQRPLVAQTLNPGQTVNINVALDGQPTTWFLDGGGIAMDLIAPDGTRYQSDRLLLGDTVAHLPYRDAQQLFQPFDLWSTRNRPGLWQAHLTNKSESPVAVRLALVQPYQPALSISLEQPWLKGGDVMTINVKGRPKQTLIALLADQQVTLVEQTVGNYRATLNAPNDPGYHSLRVVGKQVERWAVVGVYNEAWSVTQVEATQEERAMTVNLTLEGEGKVALGLRLMQQDQVVATRLIGPMNFSSMGPHILTERIQSPAALDDLRLEWQLFDANGALVPVLKNENLITFKQKQRLKE